MKTRRLLLLVVGWSAVAAGVALVNAAAGTLSWPRVALLERYVTNPAETLAGLCVAVMGAAVVAVAMRRDLVPDVGADTGAAIVDARPEPRRLLWAFTGVCAATLAARLAFSPYEIVDLALFGAVLALGTLTVRSLDPRRHRATGLRRFDVVVGAVIVTATTALHSIGSDHWLFTSIGDELPFFEMARDIAQGARAWNPFDVVGGVYETHSFADSAYQAAVMRLTGRVDVIGWRLGIAVLMGLAAAGLYLTGVVLHDRWVGLAAAGVLASSHYLMAFSHIGYNNPHAVFANVMAALALSVAWRTGRWHHHWLAGVALGSCLYTFLAGLAFWVVAAAFVSWDVLRRRSPRHRLAVAFLLLGFAATVAPALWVTTVPRLTDVISANSVVLAGSHHGSTDPLGLRWDNLVRSVLAFWSRELVTGHHLGGPLVDPLTGGLLVAGVVAAAARIAAPLERLALLWLVVGLVLIAASHYEITPSTSRLLTLMPAVALLCGVAARGFIASFEGRASRAAGVVACVLLWTVLPRLNVHQLFVQSPARAMVASRLVMVMKALQERPPRTIVDVGNEADGNIDTTLVAYPWLKDRYRFLSHAELESGGLTDVLAVERPPVFFVDAAYEPVAYELEPRLPPTYRKVEDHDRTGGYRTFLFVPAGP